MNIGVDMDGVLADIQDFNRRHAIPFFKRKFNREVDDESQYDVRDIFHCADTEYKAYWNRYLLKYALFEPARKNARGVMRQLHLEGHRLFIVSKRVFTCRHDFVGMLMRCIVRIWLHRNQIHYDKIVFCDNDKPDSKRDACIANCIDVMIDDEPVNINAITGVATVICYDASYNRNCKGAGILRTRDFDEMYQVITNLSQ